MLIKLLILSIIGGILYRLGGKGKPFNTKYRDLGCSAIMLISMWLGGSWHWSLLLCFGLMFAFLTTYWDTLFGYDNFYMHGFMVGLAMLPLVLSGIPWWLILTRAIFLGIFVGLWSKLIDKDWLEEFGRGFLINFSLCLLI